jgi:PAS domain S-box-containing protein
LATTGREGRGLTARTGMISDANDTRPRATEGPKERGRDEEVRSWLTAIVQSSNDAIIGKALDGTITSWNAAAERLYGYTAGEAVGRPVSFLVPPEQPDEVPALLARVKRGEFVANYETKKLAKDGRRVDVSLTMSPIRGPGGDLIGASTVARDETERKRTDEALRKNTTLLELLRGAATASNEASGFEEAMRSCLALMRGHLGIPLCRVYLVPEGAGEAVSTNVRYSEDPGRFDAFVRATDSIRFALGLPAGRVLAGGEPVWIDDVREEPGFLRAEAARACGLAAGFAVPVLVRREVVAVLEFFTTEAREPDPWLLGVLRQVGTQLGRVVERERAERELNRLNRELETRNLELSHKNAEVEAFVYSVSHDLRSPLVNLEGFSQELGLVCEDIREILADGDLSPEVRRRGLALVDEDMTTSTHFIREAVKRLSNIIDALLRLSRVGRLEYRWRPVDLSPIVGRVVDAMDGTLAERGARVVVGDLPPAWGDPTALEQVFANLIGNAVLYLDPARPGLVEVGCEDAGDGDLAGPAARTYYVRDNGVGIPEGAVEKVFKIFQRLHPKHADGEGMGLALVQRIVERHDGEVWVESVEGEGSTFFVRLPAKGEVRD